MASIALGVRDEEFIKRQLVSGEYANETEVVQAGLQLLEEFENAREHWLKAMPGRMEELLADPSKGIPAAKIFDDLEARHQGRLAQIRK